MRDLYQALGWVSICAGTYALESRGDARGKEHGAASADAAPLEAQVKRGLRSERQETRRYSTVRV